MRLEYIEGVGALCSRLLYFLRHFWPIFKMKQCSVYIDGKLMIMFVTGERTYFVRRKGYSLHSYVFQIIAARRWLNTLKNEAASSNTIVYEVGSEYLKNIRQLI